MFFPPLIPTPAKHTLRALFVVIAAWPLLAATGLPAFAAESRQVADSVKHLRARVAALEVNPQTDIAPVVALLQSATSDDDVGALVSALADAGGARAVVPAAAKAYVQHKLGPAVLAVARQDGVRSSYRSRALMLLREVDASDADLLAAAALARAEVGEAAKFMASRAELLDQWRQNRPPERLKFVTPRPTDLQKEKAALAYLREAGLGGDVDGFARSVQDGQPRAVQAYLDAGFRVNAKDYDGSASTLLLDATAVSCIKPDVSDQARAEVLALLVAQGAAINAVDEMNNTVLTASASTCSLAFLKTMLDVGANPNLLNKQGHSALGSVLIAGQWDKAELLINRGARLPKNMIDAIFFEKPTDPAILALIKRATGAGGK